MATITVKHVAANAEQIRNIQLCCQIGKSMGATPAQLAGAVATMIQESTAINMQGGDRDSAGLYQQRPSCGWGTYAQVTNPTYAITKFMTPYLNYCRQGMSVLVASDKVQGSAYPSAPGQWLGEATADVGAILGSNDFGDVTSLGGSLSLDSTTRTLPYEFSRGSAGQPESSWDCMGRLATEVQWDRFMRGGRLWFVSEEWLAKQTPRFNFSEGAQGVLAITFEADSRQTASEATVTVNSGRWTVLPGDVCRINGQGPGNGLWLVSGSRRSVASANTEITLKRPTPQLDEPANDTSTTTASVGGITSNLLNPSSLDGGAAGGSTTAQRIYNAAKAMSDMNIPYSKSQRNLIARPPSADCSSSCSWALLAAGVPLPGGVSVGGWAPVSGQFESWGLPGPGQWVTIMCSGEHIWLRFTGVGSAWRFDTSPYGSGGYGPHLRFTPRPITGFTQRHWQGT